MPLPLPEETRDSGLDQTMAAAAERAYNAWNADMKDLTPPQLEPRPWTELQPRLRQAWMAAAKAVLKSS